MISRMKNLPSVALRKESVDRNWQSIETPDSVSVALRKESVDRNTSSIWTGFWKRVALRKESVDRNLFFEYEGDKR